LPTASLAMPSKGVVGFAHDPRLTTVLVVAA
jgi:hypothetical protein